MSYWILVMKGSREEFLKRLKEGSWPIYKYTKNRNNLKKGDEFVFYIGGESNKMFVGSGTIESELVKEDETNFFVKISNTKVWKTPLFMKDIVRLLEFIPNKKNWGAYLQGGVVWLTKKDYLAITGAKGV